MLRIAKCRVEQIFFGVFNSSKKKRGEFRPYFLRCVIKQERATQPCEADVLKTATAGSHKIDVLARNSQQGFRQRKRALGRYFVIDLEKMV